MIENFHILTNFYSFIKDVHYRHIHKIRNDILKERPTKYFMNLKNENERICNLNILSSHNSYLNNYQNFDYADISNIEYLIKLGVRCIELDIYYINNELVVCHGTKNIIKNFDFITTNSIKLETIFQLIKNNSFKEFSDLPMFINLELLTHNSKEAHMKIADLIQKYFFAYILHSKFQYNNKNIGKCKLKQLRKKIIFINGNILNHDDPLKKYINIQSFKINEINTNKINDKFLLNFSDYEIENNKNIIKKHLKNKGLIRVYPRGSLINQFSGNYDYKKMIKLGIQFNAINIQQMNSISQSYLKDFEFNPIKKIKF